LIKIILARICILKILNRFSLKDCVLLIISYNNLLYGDQAVYWNVINWNFYNLVIL